MDALDKELLILKIRSMIADKEHINAMLNGDVAKFGEPQRDYSSWYQEVEERVHEGFSIMKDFSI